MAFYGLQNPVYAGIAAQIPDLTTYALARCPNRTTAEDLVQECIVRALTKAARFRSERELQAWLFTILHNLCITEPRFDVGDRPAPLEAAEQVPSPPAIAGHRLLLRALAKAAMTLPPRQRRALALIAVEDQAQVEPQAAIPLHGSRRSAALRDREQWLH